MDEEEAIKGCYQEAAGICLLGNLLRLLSAQSPSRGEAPDWGTFGPILCEKPWKM